MIWFMEIYLHRKTASVKVLREKGFDITKYLKYNGHQRDLH